MKKKLYKAKKNWVIGFIAATTLILGGTTIASADSNASSVNSNLASQSQVSTYPSFKSLVVTSTQDSPTVGMSSQIASNPVGDYNKDNVGYINPNQERNVYNDQVENDSYKIDDPGSLKYREKLLNGFAKGNDQIKNYGTPSVYEYIGDANNPYKYVDPQPITSINKWDTPTYHFLNNGISNAIHYENTNGDPNYEAINHLSQALSYADYQHLTDLYSHTHQDKNFGVFYDGDKAIIAPNSGLTTQDLDALYWAAYKNRPIVTFDNTVHGHHITSILQSSIQAFDDGWKLSFDAGWRGYTFMDGEQIRFTDIIRSDSKKFSWKNVILRYFAQSLAYKSNEGSQRTPYMLTRSNYLPATDIPDNGGPLENPLNPSITEFAFTKNGVYTIINGAMAGYDPIIVQTPNAFLKKDFQDFYGTSETPVEPTEEIPQKPTKPATPNKNQNSDTFDQRDNDKQYVEDTLEQALIKYNNNKVWGDSVSNLEKNVRDNLSDMLSGSWGIEDVISTLSSGIVSEAAEKSMSRYLLHRLDIFKDAAVDVYRFVVEDPMAVYGIRQNETAKADKLAHFKKARKNYLKVYSNGEKNVRDTASDLGGIPKSGIYGVILSVAIAIGALATFNKRNLLSLANRMGIKVTDKWKKRH